MRVASVITITFAFLVLGISAAGAAAATVTDVRATALNAGSASVTWEAPGMSRAWIEVGRSSPFGVWYPARRQSGGRFTVTLTGLAPATTYSFRIRSFGVAGRDETVGTVATAPIPARTHARTSAGRFVLDGQKFFPIMAWWQCPAVFGRLIELGVNLFMGGCKIQYGPDFLASLGGRAYATLPVADAAEGIDGPGLIGWNYPDEPEGYGIPASALPDLPPPSSTGRVRLLTSTYHFYRNAAPLAPGRGHEIYAPYWAKADVIGFDLYPLEKLCSHRLGLRDVYEAHRQLTEELPAKPTYQWIETGPLEGECGWSKFHTTPATVRAEVWMAIAGGAAGVGYFTHTWQGPFENPFWQPFDVAPDVQAEIARTNLQIGDLGPALAGPAVAVKLAGRSPVVVGARAFNGALYVIAVNPTYAPAAASIRIKGLGSRVFTVFGESRSVKARRSLLADRFEPLAVHVYIAAPR